MLKKVRKIFSANSKEKENIDNNEDEQNNKKKNSLTSDRGKLETDAAPVDPNESDSLENNLVPYSNNSLTTTASADMTQQAIQELTRQPSSSMELVQHTNNNNLALINSPVPAVQSISNPQNCTVYQISNLSGVHLGHVYNINSTNTNTYNATTTGSCQEVVAEQPLKCDKSNRPKNLKTRSIVDMMLSIDEPNHRLLDTVSRHLGATWKEVMRNLGHSDGQIEQSIIDHKDHGGTKEVIYQLLLSWMASADDGKATVGTLTTLLWNTEHYDVVQKMKIEWKKQQRENRI